MVKLKLNTETARVIHTDNIIYSKSVLNALGMSCYLWKLKCTKFTFCIIILKFRFCVCVEGRIVLQKATIIKVLKLIGCFN